MDGVSLALRGSTPACGEPSASVGGPPNRPDFKFWADVFSKAQGVSPDVVGTAPDAPAAHGPQAAASAMAVQGASSTDPWQTADALGARAQHPALTATAGLQTKAPWVETSQGVAAAFPHVPMPVPAPMSAHAGSDALAHPGIDTEPRPPSTTSTRHPVPAQGKGASQAPVLSAHLQRNGQGAWTVVLRMPQRMSVPSALGLVAQAVHQEGLHGDRVELVVLNGRRVYQGHVADAPLPASFIQSIDWTL